jgi:hypothetical protein
MISTFEAHLVDICAPTLAGLKIAGLFHYAGNGRGSADDPVFHWNGILTRRGVAVTHLKAGDGGSLVYVFRPDDVVGVLRDHRVSTFLSALGYGGCAGIDDYLSVLRHRLQDTPHFPHEIGIFLGYPLHDVTGFIDNKGKNFCFSGFWKVYAQANAARQLFARLQRCHQNLKARYDSGTPVPQLTVSGAV